MAVQAERPLVSPVLVGRAAEMAQLNQALARACGGRGRTLLLVGEAGIGKTRLVAEVQARIAAADTSIALANVLAVSGSCFESDSALPYAPLLDLLRTLFSGRAADDIARQLGHAAPELVKLLPELASRLPGVAPTAALDPPQEKGRLFYVLSQFLVHLANTQPLLIVVEDLHWSDDTSLEFLLYLARRIATRPILLLLTYRGEDAQPSLSRFLAELNRARLAHEIGLTRLSRLEVAAMLREMFDLPRPVRAEFLDAIYGLTEGNPFFIEEVLNALIAVGDIFYADEVWDRKPLNELRIPRSVQDAVRRRTTRLSPAAQNLLRLAAVVGRRFDFALLQAVSAQAERELLALLKELIAAQLIVEESAERFAFRHALTRQAIYADLLARERRALHEAVATALEGLCAPQLDAHLADLAEHWAGAGAGAKTVDYARRLGDQAQTWYAPRAAVEQFSRALDAAQRLAAAPDPRLYQARGRAYETLGEFDSARADYEQALRAARDGQDRLAEWQGLLALGYLWLGRDYAAAGQWLRAAFDLARTLDDPAIRAHSLNRLGNWHLNVDQPREGIRHHQEALAIFYQIDDRRGLAETFDLLGMASTISGDLAQSALYYQQAVARFQELDDRGGLASSLPTLMACSGYSLNDTLVPAALSPAEAAHEGERALALAREIGWRSGEAYALVMLGACLGYQGAYGRALPLVQEGLALAAEIEHREWLSFAHCILGALSRDLLALPAAQQHLAQARALAEEIGSRFWLLLATGLLASTAVEQNNLAQAEALLAAALDPTAWRTRKEQRRLQCVRAELALRQGQPRQALAIADQLMAAAANVANGQTIPRLAKLRGDALAALGQGPAADTALVEARAAAQARGIRPLLWRIRVALGQLYQAEARPLDAAREFTAARALIEELAASVPDESLRSGFLAAATAPMPRDATLSPRRTAPPELTGREREVAALIAQGYSNADIAHALVLSERTVETHVRNSLAKLGFASRAQIAAWAVEHGLARTISS